MLKPKLLFYFDLQSPYAYLAHSLIRTSDIFKECDISYVPILMIGFVKAGVSTPPWESKNKPGYLMRDLTRWAELKKIPWQPGWPANFPLTRTSDVQRAIAACNVECPDKVSSVLDALYHAFWVEKRGVQAPDVYEPILRQALGDPMAETVILLSASDKIKALTRQNTADAIASGACGLPWFVATNASGNTDVFWGFDHLGLVASFLGLNSLPPPHM